MKKSVLKMYLKVLAAQWSNIGWACWMGICITCMCFPVFGYPGQLVLTFFGRSLLSAIEPLAEWTVRHHSVYGDEMWAVACADCGRIFFVSCIIAALVDLLIAFGIVYVTTDEKKNKIEKDSPSCKESILK